MRPALVFIGFMAAGKSTAARAAAAELGVEAADTDELLERHFGEPVEAFFDREGEAAFREREEALVCELLEHADGSVVALGGGALGSARVRDALRRHTAVLLEVTEELAWQRAKYRGHQHLLLAGDPVLVGFNTLQHWLWQRLQSCGSNQVAA